MLFTVVSVDDLNYIGSSFLMQYKHDQTNSATAI